MKILEWIGLKNVKKWYLNKNKNKIKLYYKILIHVKYYKNVLHKENLNLIKRH